SLMQDEDDNLYGTVAGPTGGASVFRIAPNGAFSFFAQFPPGFGVPFFGGPLVKGPDDNFYGIANIQGRIFRLTTNALMESLLTFVGTNGWYPATGLTLGSDGNFYSTTAFGGARYKRHPAG